MNIQELFNKIDFLVSMANDNRTPEILRSELRIIESDINSSKKALSDFLSTRGGTRYFKTAELTRDNNFELHYKDEIATLDQKILEENEKLNEVMAEEAKLSNKIADKELEKKTSLYRMEIFTKRINEYAHNESKKNITEKFKEDIIVEEANQVRFSEELDGLTNEYQLIQDHISAISFSIQNLQNELSSKKEDLKILSEKLSSKDNYDNRERRSADDSIIFGYQDTIATLRAKKNEISNSPVLLAEEVKNMIHSGNSENEVLNKIQEIINEIEKIPYMSLTNKEIATEGITEELGRLLHAKEEMINKIKNSTYNSTHTEIETGRMVVLEERKKALASELKSLRKKLETIDSDSRYGLSSMHEKAMTYLTNLEEQHKEYEKIIAIETGNTNIETRAKHALLMETKRLDLENASLIANNYSKERQREVEEGYEIVTHRIPDLEQRMAETEIEIRRLNEIIFRKQKQPQDIIAATKDEKELNEIERKIISLKYRKRFKVAPSEMLPEIKELLKAAIIEKQKETVMEKPFILVRETHPAKTESIKLTDNNLLPGLEVLEFSGGMNHAA